MTPREVLDLALSQQTLSALDAAFGAAVVRWSGATGETAALIEFAAAAASRGLAQQQVFVDLRTLAQDDPFGVGDARLYPDPDALTAALSGAPVTGPPGAGRPLVLQGSRLYLARQFDLEATLAAGLTALALAPGQLSRPAPASAPAPVAPHPQLSLALVPGHLPGRAAAPTIADAPDPQLTTRLRGLLRALFPDEAAEAINWQRIGAAIAVSRRLAVITGGPGTGKTTTVTRLLATLLQVNPALRIALAAPTGKAAARLAESVLVSKARLRQQFPGESLLATGVLDAVPDHGTTLHRLLGFRPAVNDFRYGAAAPLPFDVVVVDEASMLDLRLACALLAALPDNARLILLGDKDQLSSVDAGMVLGDLCAGLAGHFTTGRFSGDAARRLGTLTGYDLESLSAPSAPPLADTICWLRVSRRFAADSAIGRMAEAVNAGDAAAVLALCGAQLASPGDAALMTRAGDAFAPLLALAGRGGDPRELLDLLGRFRVLAAVREGRDGVLALNARLERALAAAGLIDPAATYYIGRPLLITVNDHRLGVYNGDVGIVVATADGPRVALPDARSEARSGARADVRSGVSSGVRLLHPRRLPAHETVFAMTVHKSQGSEFDEVALVLPRAPSLNERSILTRELVYTALTRARIRVVIHAEEAVLRAAVASPTRRASGLRDALWGVDQGESYSD